VTLYKHGIGHFERSGTVKSPGIVELQCGPDEIDDMLKSLLVLKKGGGKVSAITYESSKPLDERLGEFGFDLKNSQNFADLVGQLKGTPVSVKVGAKEMSGRVVGLDSVRRVFDNSVVEDRYMLLFSDENILHRIEVNAIGGIEIKDAALAKELHQQLELLFLSVKKKDRKLLKVDLPGDGDNDLIIAYSIPCPIWKTSYRLVFDSEDKLLIQGVAIVDNTQEEDWNDVRMVLVSSSPVSFIQPLYEPIKPFRRTIQTQGVKSSGPFVAERAQKMRARQDAPSAPLAAPGSAGNLARSNMLMKQEMETGAWGGYSMDEPVAAAAPQSAAMDSLAEMASQALDVNTSEKGEMFEYKIGGTVSVPRNSSALIPVVQQYIEGERLSLYNETRDAEFPYATLRLKNTTGLTLEAGPATVMEDDSYAGECLLDVVKPDDTRFLPYALDQSVRVIVRNDYQRKPIWRVQVYDGMLFLYHKEVTKRTYNLENLASKTKTVYVEHPVQESWELSSLEKPEETTKSFYRFRIDLDEKASHALEVDQEKQITTQFHLVGLDPGWHQLQWLFAQNYSDPKFTAFMKQVQEKRIELVQLEGNLNSVHHRIQSLEQEQERARENVKTLGASGERFKQAIEQTEDKIIGAQNQLEQLDEAIRVKTEELGKFVWTRMDATVVSAT
jgi:hypothetical protein